MSANQTPVRRPAPVTQRDGSALQNSNCRMASISTGLDYETRGKKVSTGGRMRSHTTDQEGGTDSGDARQAWDRGYSEVLTIEDGSPWSDAVIALRGGRAINLDVWHETVGGPCLSGSGRYGHNMFVLPDCKDGAWLVSDPWCKPASWVRVSEAKLRAGAEEWGRRVFDSAGDITYIPKDDPAETGGDANPQTPEEYQEYIAQIARTLMDLWAPGHPAPVGWKDDTEPDDDTDTGGANPVLFTTTHKQPLQEDDMAEGVAFESTTPPIGEAVTTKEIGLIPTQGGPYYSVPVGYKRHVYQTVTVGSGQYVGQPGFLVVVPGSMKDMGILLASAAKYTAYPPPSGDSAARDEEWRNWLLAGSPGSE